MTINTNNSNTNEFEENISEKVKIHEIYDITKHYKSRTYIKNDIIPDIKNKIKNSFCNSIYNYFSKSTINEYNKIVNICDKQLQINSYIDIYNIINDIIMRDNEEYIEYFYISYNNYDLLNYSLIKSCEEYFINLIKYNDFSLEYLACKNELKILLGKYYFYSVICSSLINEIISNELNNFNDMIYFIKDEVKNVDITELIINFLPSCKDDDIKNINYDSDYDSESSFSNDSDIEEFYEE